MNLLDIRTVLLGELITDVVCSAVLIFLWWQNRKRYAGMFFWAADLVFQTISMLLVTLRGRIPDWASIGLSDPFVIAGALLGYWGLKRFVGNRSSQIHNYILLGGFILAHLYFSFIDINLNARNFILSLGLLLVCAQCAWLLLHRVGSGMTRTVRSVGWVFVLFMLVSFIRIFITLANPVPSNNFLQSGLYDALVLLSFQILLILFTFGLVLMVNWRLLLEVRYQEEKYTRAFHSSPYAILITRLEDGMIMDVNRGFEEITGYLPSEAVGKTTLDIHLWVNEADRQEVAAELIARGEVKGKEFQFRTKSGSERAGMFYAGTLVVENEQLILSSIGDITERKQAESQRQSFYDTLNASLNELYIFNADTLHFEFVSAGALKNLGYTLAEMVAMTPLDIKPEYTASSFRELVAPLRHHEVEVVQFETVHRRADGSRYPVEVHLQLFDRLEHSVFLAVILDTTERKRAEEALRESERRLSSIYNTVGDIIFHLAVESEGQYRFLSVNPSFCRFTGLSKEQIVGKAVTEVIPEPSLTMVLGKYRQAIEENTIVRWEEVSDYPAGRLTGEVSIAPVFDHAGHCMYLVGSVHDITERKKTETELSRLNRALRMIGDCNQVLVRAKYEQELLAEICRIVTDAGGYRMAWVGYADQDEAHTVRSVASAGFEKGYLESANISWADIPRGQGPTGTAIRTRKPVACGDFQTDPRLEPWRTDATKRGYRSSIALPLILDEQCLGALTIYSAEANRFGEDEEKLLIELANDLAYGITALRTRAEHEKALVEIENMARFPGENPSPVLRIDRNGKVLYNNEAGRRLLTAWKVSKTGLVSTDWRKRVAKSLDSGLGEIIEQQFGSYVMEIRMIPISERGYVNLYGTDITERKKMYEALRESEDKFRYDFDYSVVGRSITQTTGEIQVNKAFCNMLGYSPEDLQNKKWQEITYPDDIETNQKALDLIMAGKQESARFTKRYIKKDGSILWGDLNTSLRRDSEGKPLYYMSTLVDITERKMAEEKIRELNESLEQRVKERTTQLEAINRELETFSYSVAHDLKAPLRGIDGYSRLLQEDYANKLDENGQAFLKNIRSATVNMNQLIEDLLAYSRMERRSFASAEINIRSMVESLLEARSVEIASKSIQMKVDLPFEEVNADIDGLSAVLRNLLDNAIKFTGKVKHPKIELGGKESADTKLLWVRDNGIGFEMQYAERIFEIFQRLQRTEDYPGTGVGLAIVRKAMQRMGGRVWAESEPGKGATFFLEFRRNA